MDGFNHGVVVEDSGTWKGQNTIFLELDKLSTTCPILRSVPQIAGAFPVDFFAESI